MQSDDLSLLYSGTSCTVATVEIEYLGLLSARVHRLRTELQTLWQAKPFPYMYVNGVVRGMSRVPI